MASQLTVLGPGARRHTTKVTPGTYLNDVLSEACTKFRLDPSQYTLKHNGKTVDLSRTLRLSGLTSGAKLELTQTSRSPSIVSVAIQQPDNTRLIDKFPSNTSLWLILRKFESGVAGDGAPKNFTGRGVPKAEVGSASGRLYHEAPALHIMGRDYTSFLGLQKTLGQLGFNDGNVLLKLSFYTSDDPLEEAMERIAQYFKSVDGKDASGAHADTVTPTAGPGQALTEEFPQAIKDAEREFSLEPPNETETAPTDPQSTPSQGDISHDTPIVHETPITNSNQEINGVRPTIIYGPPSSATPQAAQQVYNPQDYVPSVEHAKAHQANLNRASINKRLPTDAEIEAEKAAMASKLQEVNEVSIKVRFPDQSSAVAPFKSGDTVDGLYLFVQSLMTHGTEPFVLQLAGPKGQTQLPRSQKQLIKDLGLTNRVLISVVWSSEASAEARKGPSMKADIAAKQQQYLLQEVAEPKDNEAVGGGGLAAKNQGNGKEKKKDGVPKWLKPFGKK